jgi:octaprenyl-diphosphate synthase
MNAPARKLGPVPPNPAQTLMALAGEDMACVDALILERMQSPVGMIPDLAQHLVGAGGKRLRPLLTVAAAQMCGYEGQAHHNLAAAVEFIHSATLLHDDVVDQSALRRGKMTANRVWGNSSSILVGDFLFARAFNLMVETGSMEALDILARASSVIAEGEVNQLASLRDVNMSEDHYLEVIGAKTAALFAAACEVSPVIAERPDVEREALRTYGHCLGIAFQLVDDMLDYGGLETALGKSVGDDFREGKMTLPVIRALTVADEEERAFWHRVIVDLDQSDVDLERAVSYLRRAKALRSTLREAENYVAKAREALSVFPRSEWTDALGALADYVIERRS